MSWLFELWLRGCEINGTLVYLLEGSGENALYKLTKEIMIGSNIYYKNPVYMGWVDGEEVCATTNYLEAYHIWENRIKQLKKEM